MEPTLIGFLSLVVALVTLLYGIYRVVRKDSDKVVQKLETCARENTANKASIKLLHQRIENVESNHDKLESTMEKMMDKVDVKLDKIMDFLLDIRSN